MKRPRLKRRVPRGFVEFSPSREVMPCTKMQVRRFFSSDSGQQLPNLSAGCFEGFALQFDCAPGAGNCLQNGRRNSAFIFRGLDTKFCAERVDVLRRLVDQSTAGPPCFPSLLSQILEASSFDKTRQVLHPRIPEGDPGPGTAVTFGMVTLQLCSLPKKSEPTSPRTSTRSRGPGARSTPASVRNNT